MEPFGRVSMRWFAAVAGLCALTVALVAARVHEVRGPLAADSRAQTVVRAHAWGVPLVPGRVAEHYRDLGTLPWVAVLVVVAVLVAALVHDYLMVAVALAGPPIAVFLVEEVGKPLVARPEFGGYGFPSGHTTAIASLAIVAALIVHRHLGRRALAVAVGVLATLTLAMILTVVRIDAHYLSDALAGVLLGVGTVLGVAALASLVAGSVEHGRAGHPVG